MKKNKLMFVASVLVVLVAIATSCASTPPTNELATNMTGWSDYATITVKDFDAVGIVRVTAAEQIKNGIQTGSTITYDMLIAEAVKLGADDIINVRIDVQTSVNKDVLTKNYIGNALAIKYKDATIAPTASQKNPPSGMYRGSTSTPVVEKKKILGIF